MSSIAQFRPPPVVQQDAEVARALRVGDRDALRVLIEQHGACVVAAAGVAANDDVGREIAGHVFAAAWARADAIEPGADFAPWLADLLAVTLDSSGRGDADGVDGSVLLDRSWTLRSSLDALSDADRDLLRLRHLQGLGLDEVADRVGTTADDVRSRLLVVHRRLAAQLAHLADDEPASSDGAADELAPELAELLGDRRLWEPFDESAAAELLAVAGGDPLDRGNGSEADRADVTDPATVAVGRPFISKPVLFGLIGAGLTILLLGAGIVAFSAAGEPPAVATFDAEMVPTGLVPDVDGTIEVTELDTGLRIELDAPTLPRRAAGSFYEGWLRLDDDRLVPVGTFQQGTDVTLSAGIELDRVVEMVVTLGAAAADDDRIDATSQVVLKADFPTE